MLLNYSINFTCALFALNNFMPNQMAFCSHELPNLIQDSKT